MRKEKEVQPGQVISSRINASKVRPDASYDELQQAFGQVGLYLPHLCLRYLFQMRCLLLERFLLITGPPGVNKSSFMYWLYHLFRLNSGNYIHIHSEDKDTPTLRLSILQYDRDAGWTFNAKTLDEIFALYKEKLDWMENEIYPQYKIQDELPLIIGIDSLTAKLSEDTLKKLESNYGVPERRYSFEAALLADWFRVSTSRLQNKPYFLVAINHEKPRVTPTGLPSAHIPGGVSQNFVATYRLHLEREKTIPQSAQGWEGNQIKLKATKSSGGSTNVSISAEILWKTENRKTKSGKSFTYQVTVWNWYKSTAQLLLDISKTATPAGKFIKDKMKLEKSMGRYKAKGIGINDYVDCVKFSEAIESNHDLLDELEPLLGIRYAVSFKPGISYLEQLKQARSKSIEEFETVLQNNETSTSQLEGNDEINQFTVNQDSSELPEIQDQEL